METKYIALYAGDTRQEGTVCGPETVRRCERCISFIQQHPTTRSVIVLGAGTRPDKSHYPLLKKVMHQYLTDRLELLSIQNVSIVVSQTDAWNTFNETVAIAQIIDHYKAKKVFIISSWYHLMRIRMIWKLVRPNHKSKLITAYSPKISSLFRELIAIVKVLLKDYRIWQKNPL